MSQVAQVRPGLYLSGSDPALRLSVLSSRSITLVVNASGLQDLVYPPLEGLSVLNVPLQDQPHAPLKLYFDLVGERIHQNRTGRTLVHCSAGRSRSPSLIIAYLMRFEGLSLRRAHEAVLEQRPFIRPNAGFWRQLMEYERSLFGRNTMRMVSTPGGVLPEALRLPEDLPEALRLPEDLPEALRLPEDLPEALRLPEDLPEALRLPEDLPEALRLPEDLPEALRLPEDLPEALRLPEDLPEDPEPAYCLNI